MVKLTTIFNVKHYLLVFFVTKVLHRFFRKYFVFPISGITFPEIETTLRQVRY